MPCIVAGIEALDDLACRLTVVDEAAGVHTADTGTIPAFVSRVSRPGSLSEPSTVQTPITIAVDHLVEYEKDAPAVAVAVAAPARAPGYLGAYAFASLPATANEDDTALAYSATSSQRGIYAMIAGTWTKLAAPSVDVLSRAWPDISRATLAVADGGFAGGPYGVADDYFGSGVDVFSVLAAQTAFIESLFAKQITIQTGGLIKSSNYSAGTAGFQVEADGSAEFNDVTVRGAFEGTVDATSIEAVVEAGKTTVKKIASIAGTSSLLESGYLEFAGAGEITISYSYSIYKRDGGDVDTVQRMRPRLGETSYTTIRQKTVGASEVETGDDSFDVVVGEGDIFKLSGQYAMAAVLLMQCQYTNFSIKVDGPAGILSWLGYTGKSGASYVAPR